MNNTTEEIIEKLNSAKNVAVFCHARPDGDALGGALALCIALNNAGKNAVMCCEDEVPEKFLFLPTMSLVNHKLPQNDYDTFISVDCADLARMGVFTDRYRKFKGCTINIDHHFSNTGYAKYNYVLERPASCEVLTDLFRAAGYEITEDMANLLMLGVITDSGNFSHADVTANTYICAAALRDCGADVQSLNYHVFSRQTKERALLYARAMSTIGFALDGLFAYIFITQEAMKELGADKSLTEGFIDFPLSVDGVEVAASLLEFKKGEYKISLRSKGRVNVNDVAAKFGGGGHVLASGCMIFGEQDEALAKLIEAVKQGL